MKSQIGSEISYKNREKQEKQIKVTMDNLGAFLVKSSIWPFKQDDQIGVVTDWHGLVGGDLLHIEVKIAWKRENENYWETR